jgi:hypothetical protein
MRAGSGSDAPAEPGRPLENQAPPFTRFGGCGSTELAEVLTLLPVDPGAKPGRAKLRAVLLLVSCSRSLVTSASR